MNFKKKKEAFDLMDKVSDYLSKLNHEDQEKVFGYLLEDLQSKGESIPQDIRLICYWWTKDLPRGLPPR